MNKQQLAAKIWESANQMRSKIEANEYKDYNLNEYGRFDDLRETVDQQKAKAYFEGVEGKTLPLFRVNIKAAKLLSDFLLRGGIELNKAG